MSVSRQPRATALLRQQRSRDTRARLVQAAQVLWVRDGFDTTHVAEICRVAGVSVGAFYFHFPRKEDLLVELAAMASNRLWSEYEQLASTDATTLGIVEALAASIAGRVERAPREFLGRTLTELFAATDAHWHEVLDERKGLREVFIALLRRGQDRGEVGDRFDTNESAGVLAMVAIHAQQTWARGMEEDLAALIVRRLRIVLEGLGP